MSPAVPGAQKLGTGLLHGAGMDAGDLELEERYLGA